MKEEYLHHVFKTKQLGNTFISTKGQQVKILDFGKHNYNAGPDFLECKVKIDNKIWAGQIEFHVKSSDWLKHNHQNDSNYNNVILHFVYEFDMDIQSGKMILPTVELKNIINQKHYGKYQNYINSKNWVACQNDLKPVDEFIIYQQKEKALLNRLERKSNLIIELINQLNGDRKKVLFIQLFKAFGTNVNKTAFEKLGVLFDWKIISKLNKENFKIQAYLFGLAGFLSKNIDDDYFNQLKTEFNYQKKLFDLQTMNFNEWKFSAMRPANFPTVRLAQLSHLLCKNTSPVESLNFEHLKNNLTIQLDEYWEVHYDFGKIGKRKTPNLTPSFIDLLLINVYIPYVFSISRLADDEQQKLTAFEWLEKIKPEKNSIIDKWKKLNIEIKSAFDSQSLIEQKNEFCSKNQCLKCKIGNALLKTGVC